MNLLQETFAVMVKHNLDRKDIIFIGSVTSGHSCTVKQFERMANDDYDPGFGSAHVATDLVIAFANGYRLERHEYDGSEWWNVVKPFIKPVVSLPIVTLFARYGSTLEEIHE